MNYRYVLGILNCSLINYWFEYYYGTTKVRGNYFDLNGNQIKSIPIAIVNSGTQLSISNLVDQILSAKKANPQADTSSLEAKIDRLVYGLYGLTEEEIAIIEGTRRNRQTLWGRS